MFCLFQGQESNPVLKRLSGLGHGHDGHESEREEETLHEEPPASALHRRRALVPPKLITDGYESSTEEADPNVQGSTAQNTNL